MGKAVRNRRAPPPVPELELAFWELIENDPRDLNTRLVFADYLDERKDHRADGMRLAVGRGPYRVCLVAGVGGRDEWTWFNAATVGHIGLGNLPGFWFDRLAERRSVYRGREDPEHAKDWRDYLTFREAEDDACRAFALLTPLERDEALLRLERWPL